MAGHARRQAAPDRTSAAAGAQGLLFDDDLPDAARGRRLPRSDRLPAAGITYRQLDYWARTGLVVPSVRRATGLRHPAALLVPRHPRAQGRQAAARHRRLAAEHPQGDRAPARVRRRRPGHDDPDDRRRQRLRVHARPTRSSTCCRAARASSASPSAGSGRRSRARSRRCRASVPRTRSPRPTRTTSSAPGAPSASPDRLRSAWPARAVIVVDRPRPGVSYRPRS